MKDRDHVDQPAASDRISRRRFIASSAALGAGAALATSLPSSSGLAETPKQGGTLRQGLGGASTSDSFDPATWSNDVALNLGFQTMNALVEIDSKLQATPELAESWEAKPGAAEWIFNIRKGVHFHNGKELDADDVIYSLHRHMGPNSKSGAKGQLSGIKEIKKSSPHQITVLLDSGNADLPYNLSDFHLTIVPQGFEDWAHPIGTGGYVVERFEPGVRAITKRNPNYWKPGRAHFDSVETIVINDVTARTNALLSNEIDVMNSVDRKTVDLMKRSSTVEIKRSSGGQHYALPMDCESAILRDNNVRLALKYGIDRQQMLKTILRGYGHLGNDHPIPVANPFHNQELTQRTYDPDKAKYHLKKAGSSDLNIDLYASEAAFPEAIDTAALYQATGKRAGININIKRAPADGYWDNVWMKVPFSMCFWLGRPTADGTFSVQYKSDAAWNDSRWRRPAFDKLLLDARAELDFGKRKAMYWEMQRMVHEDGGEVIPVFADFIDAVNKKVQGFEPSPVLGLSGQRLAERAWFAS
jgi:peptide/nickel transport system substrate-binding protein